MKFHGRSGLRALASLLLVGSAWPAMAQDTASQDDARKGVANGTQDGEIIVTAQRRAELLEDVPAAVIAVSGEALANAGVKRFQDLATIAPGVQVSRAGSYTQPSIRGVSTTFAGGGQETNVAVYVDGFYTSDQLSINQDFANVQDIQVLKGPQGTLYGRNATGGAILITTRGPTDTLEASGSISYAPRFDDRQGSAFVGGPIAEGIKFSVAGYYRKSDGYVRDINNFAPNVPLDTTTYTFGGHGFPSIRESDLLKRGGSHPGRYQNWSVRPKLVLEPTDNLKVTLGYVHNFVDDPRAFGYQIKGNNTFNPATEYNGYPVANHRDETSLNFQPINQSKSDEFNGTVELKLGDLGSLTSRSAYRKQKDFQVYDLDATPRDPGSFAGGTTYIGIQYNHRRTFTQQLDYAGEFGNFSLLGGLFYYDDKFTTPAGVEDIGTASNPTITRLDFSTKAFAAYLDGTLNLNDKLFITVGGRYSHDKKELGRERYSQDGLFVPGESSVCFNNTRNPDYIGPNPRTTPTAGIPATCTGAYFKHVSKSAFTPRAVIRYNLSQGTNVYASISRGFKAPTINSAANFNTLEPEKVTAYEAGFKTARDGFRAELSGFYYNYTNNQVSINDPNSATIATTIQNSGGAHTYGVDATLSYRFPDTPLNLRAGLEYLHARYVDYDIATNVIVGPTGGNTSVIGDFSGRRLQRAPDWSGSVGADYTFEQFLGGKLMLSGTVTFSSRYAPQNASYQCTRVSRDAAGADIPFVTGTPGYCAAGTDRKSPGRFEENGYILANAQVTWTDASDRFSITAFGDNITSTRYKIISSAFAYSSYDAYNEPASFGVKLGFKY